MATTWIRVLSPWALCASAALMTTTGCGTSPIKGDDTGQFAYGEPDCHGDNNVCVPSLRVETNLLETCFGWDSGSETWGPGTPGVVLSECPNPQTSGQICEFQYALETDVECINDCGSCIPLVADMSDTGAFPIDDVAGPDSACCDCDLALTGLEQLESELAACSFSGFEVFDCTDPEWILLDDSICLDGGDFFRAPNADYVLYIDPVESYLTITRPGESESVAVQGGGTLNTSATAFMTSTMWADDGAFAGEDLENWVFWTDSPIDYNASTGSFVVYSSGSPLFPGRGDVDGVRSVAEIGMNNNATGSVNTATSVWDLDYTESHASGTVQLHLEGTLANP